MKVKDKMRLDIMVLGPFLIGFALYHIFFSNGGFTDALFGILSAAIGLIAWLPHRNYLRKKLD
jgi:hypothetical protein